MRIRRIHQGDEAEEIAELLRGFGNAGGAPETELAAVWDF